ncbi:MAG TPA: phosphoribosylamine--glycine ligase [Myxococcaceae bacterium]|nr:phosphoribosylamine--glycine ligase [Myxococcaceae bacterium]
MKVMLLGGGAREHALAWKLKQGPDLTALFCAPGNPGTGALGENLAVDAEDPKAVVAAARARAVDLVVVGPEAPLVKGVADALRAAGVAVFGPSAAAACIEGSKAFAKEVMAAAGIPTASHRVFRSTAEAAAYARTQGPLVVKADGLAAGKGVVVARTGLEAAEAVHQVAAMGQAASALVLEELLEGEEVSAIALCDGERYQLFPAAQDHKRIFDGDQGPNTGGMGAYAPAPFLDGRGLDEVGRAVIGPALREMKRRGTPFTGALFAGLMLTPRGPRVLEFNCRFGDPETQALVMQLDEDLLPLLHAAARGALPDRPLRLRAGATVGVVMAASGYPGSPRKGDLIEGIPQAEATGAQVFQAGTKALAGQLVTAGGRVLSVCAHGSTVATAREAAYRACSMIRFEGAQYRRDIGSRALA